MADASTAFPDAETVGAVVDLAARAPSARDSRPWRWEVGAHSLNLHAEPADPDRRDVLLSCGAALHHGTVALAAMGWRAKIHRLPDPADCDHIATIEVSVQAPSELDVMLAAAITRRCGDRDAHSSGLVPWGDIALMGARAARAGVMLRQIVAEATTEPHDDANVVVVALGTESDDELARLRAGEAASLVLLSATAMGLAGCPVTQPFEIPGGRESLRTDVFGSDGHPQMLLRLVRAASVGEVQ